MLVLSHRRRPMPTEAPLARFGHHPDPAIDFCIEVEDIEGMAYNVKVGFHDTKDDLRPKLERALNSGPWIDQHARDAKHILYKIADEHFLSTCPHCGAKSHDR